MKRGKNIISTTEQHQSDAEVLIFCIVIYGSITIAFYFNEFNLLISTPFIPVLSLLHVSLLRVVVVIE